MLELARESDREAVNALARQVHTMHIEWRPDLYTLPEEMYPEERFAESIKQRELYVARSGSLVVGYALVRIRVSEGPGLVYRKVMLVDEFAVDESCRNQGIGTQMMAEVRALARAFGCTDMQFGVYPQNDAAVAFYQKCGFMIRNINMQRKV